MPPESQLVVHLQAGLCALKTPASFTQVRGDAITPAPCWLSARVTLDHGSRAVPHAKSSGYKCRELRADAAAQNAATGIAIAVLVCKLLRLSRLPDLCALTSDLTSAGVMQSPHLRFLP